MTSEDDAATAATTPSTTPTPTTELRVVKGAADEVELEAVVASLLAYAAASQAAADAPVQEGAPRSAWMDRTRSMRGRRIMLPLSRGAESWRHSLR